MVNPRSLENILGQDTFILEVLSSLGKEAIGTVLIQGPSGSGKTWMASQIAAQMPEHFALVASGDLVRISEPFGPFDRLTESRGRLESMAVDGVRVAAGVGSTLAGFGGLGSKVFDWMVSASSTLKNSQGENLNEIERKWLNKVRRLSKGRPVVLIADNIHWWDEASLLLLEKLSDKRAWPEDSFVSQLKLIVVRTIDPSQKDHSATHVTRWTERLAIPIFDWVKCTPEQFGAALREFGDDTVISETLVQKLFLISSGNLKLAQLIAGAIADGIKADELLEEANSLGLLRSLLAERFKDRDETIEQIFSTLKSAALIGMFFYRAEAACLSSKKSDEVEVNGNLNRARESGLIEILGEKISFSHPVILDFVRRELSGNEIRDLSGKLARCLRLLRPADYGRQAALFTSSGEAREAAEATALEYLQIKRRNEVPEDCLQSNALSLLRESPIWSFSLSMGAAYDLIARGDYTSATQLLSTIPEPIERGLSLELVYAQSLAKMESGQRELSETVASDLEAYLDLDDVDAFPEIMTRMRLLQQQAYVLGGTVEVARKNSISLMSFLRRRAKVDTDAEMKFHQVLRKSNSIHDPFTAKTHLLQAINFFRPNKDHELPEFPLEYYRSHVNLSGVEIQLGNWESACESVQSAFDLVAENEELDFPRPDVALNNLNVARCRAGLDSIETSIEQQEFAANYDEALVDNFQHRSNLVGMLTLAGEFETAATRLTELEREFADRKLSEQYISFHLASRRHVLCFLMGEWSAADLEQEKLAQLLEQIDWPSKSALVLRLNMMGKLVAERVSKDPISFDNYFLDLDNRGTGPSWPHFGRGVQFSELQFWSDS